MLQIDRAFVLIGLLFAVAGMLLGLYMGIANDMKLLSVHVAFMLPGFVTLALYGILFRLYPGLNKAPMAQAVFWIAALGSAALIVGSYFYAANGSVPIAAIGSVVTILGAVLMTWLFWTYGKAA